MQTSTDSILTQPPTSDHVHKASTDSSPINLPEFEGDKEPTLLHSTTGRDLFHVA